MIILTIIPTGINKPHKESGVLLIAKPTHIRMNPAKTTITEMLDKIFMIKMI
jgi:hypothetical protein